MKRTALLVILSALLAGTARADRAAAIKLTDKAVKEHYDMNDWRGALTAYQKAVAADPTYAKVHYYIASAASIIGDFATVRKELAIVVAAAATDKDAARLVKLAKSDADLDRASGDAEVRKVLGLPGLDTLTGEQRMLERNGVWSSVDQTCGGEWVTITFKKKGKLSFDSSASCDPESESPPVAGKGTWTIGADGALNLKLKPKPATMNMAQPEPIMVPCPGEASCFKPAKGDLGTLRRGQPDLQGADMEYQGIRPPQ